MSGLSRVLLFLVLVLPAACASRGPGRESEEPRPNEDVTGLPTSWTGDVTATATHRGDADIEGAAGDVSSQSRALRATANGPLGWIGSLGFVMASYEHANYDFDRSVGFGELQNAALTAVLFQGVHRDGWGVVLLGGVDQAMERGADADEARRWTGGLGVARIVSKDLIIVVGAVVTRPAGGEMLVIPGVQLMWTINDEWKIQVIGPSAEVIWSFADDWRASLALYSASGRYRLDDGGANGYFQDSRVELALKLGWDASEWLSFEARVGVDLVREVTFRNRNGHRIPGTERDVDPTASVTVGATVKF